MPVFAGRSRRCHVAGNHVFRASSMRQYMDGLIKAIELTAPRFVGLVAADIFISVMLR